MKFEWDGKSKPKVDGYELSKVRSLFIEAEGPGKPVYVTLRLEVQPILAAGFEVEVDEQTARALEAMGWTRP